MVINISILRIMQVIKVLSIVCIFGQSSLCKASKSSLDILESKESFSLNHLASEPFLSEGIKILILTQGNLESYREALPEINPKNIYIVTCKGEHLLTHQEDFAGVHQVEDYFTSGAVEQKCFDLIKKESCDIIVATSETDILRAARLRNIFCLEGQSYKSALSFRNKIKMKKLLERKGIEVPKYAFARSVLDVLDFCEKQPYPLIVKPVLGYGSLRTHVLRDEIDLRLFLGTKGIFDEFHMADLDIEQFIDANMYHVDGIIRNGEVLAVWPSKCINNCLQMGEGKPTGGYLLPQSNPLAFILREYTLKVLKALPTPSDTGFHLELFYKDNKPIFCEIASRIGSPWINDLWVHGIGIDLKKEFIRAQAHLPPISDFRSVTPSKLIASMIFPARKGKLTSIPKTCALEGVLSYTSFVEVGEHLAKPEGMLGHISAFMFTATSEDQMLERILKVQEWFTIHLKIED